MNVVPLIKGDRVSGDVDYRDALPINMIAVERNILNARGYMISHPGLTQFAAGTGVDRGGYYNERLRIHFRVSGDRLITISENGDVTDVGEITGTDQVSFAHSFNTQAIIADGRMYLYENGGISEVSDNDLGNPLDFTWIDSYYFLTDGEFIYHTDINDERSIDPLKYATAEFSPDPTLAVARTQDNQVIVFDRYSTEWFINQANDNFAFQRIQGKSIKSGIVGTHAKTELGGQFFVLGGARNEAISIHVITGGAYRSIASREVDKLIAGYTEDELSNVVLESRKESQYSFITCHLPNHTLSFNQTIATKFGVEYAWTIVSTGLEGAEWRGKNGVFDPRVGKFIYGDKTDGRIGTLDDKVSTQYDEIAESILYTPIFQLESKSIDSLEIDTIPGHQVSDEPITCAISLTMDGVSYGREFWASYGNKYDHLKRFILRRLGYVRHKIGFKLRCVNRERVAFTFITLRYR